MNTADHFSGHVTDLSAEQVAQAATHLPKPAANSTQESIAACIAPWRSRQRKRA